MSFLWNKLFQKDGFCWEIGKKILRVPSKPDALFMGHCTTLRHVSHMLVTC